jgi:hypothetical protein
MEKLFILIHKVLLGLKELLKLLRDMVLMANRLFKIFVMLEDTQSNI